MLKTKLKILTGNLIGHKDGFGFLRPDDGSEDVFVPNREMLKAMHGDKVAVRVIIADKKGRAEAQITEVLKHAQATLVGRFIYERGIYIVVPEDNRIKHDIVISCSDIGGAKPNQIVTVEIIDPPTKDTPPIGKIIEVIGEVDDPGMEIEIAVRKFGIPARFPTDVSEYAKNLSKKIRSSDLKNRVDLRDLDFVTIDGDDAKDFDDAVYAEKIESRGWRLLVAIADVSNYVKCGDVIDREAFNRSTSVYFPRKVVPMLPEDLSNEICSLKPNVDRLSLVCDMVVTKTGKVSAYQFYEGVICSSSRLTYNHAWEIITNPEKFQNTISLEVLSNLISLYEMLEKFSKSRILRGSIDFETTETEIQVNDHGRIVKILPKIRNPAHKIIEECMIAANSCAADFLSKKKADCLFRIHESPLPEKIKALKDFLKTQGLKLTGSNEPTSKDFSALLKSAKKRTDFEVLQTLILRSMQQARYSPHNNGHFALALKKYCHFTSPIRRYPDLLVHRSIKAALLSKKYIPSYGIDEQGSFKDSIQKFNGIGEHCSIGERRAEEASRDVTAWLKCQFMKKRVGEQFTGTVTGVAPFGLFVTLETLFVEGLLHVSELGVEYFKHNEVTHELRGERTGKRHKLYDKIQIQLLRVDLDSRRMEFSLAPKLFRKPRNKKNTITIADHEVVSINDGLFQSKFKGLDRASYSKKIVANATNTISEESLIKKIAFKVNRELTNSKLNKNSDSKTRVRNLPKKKK